MFDILTDFGRIFWKDMPLDVAIRSARELEPYYGAWRVVPATGLPHNARP